MNGETVKHIQWKRDEVRVETASGKSYEANRVVVTVPVSVWRDESSSAFIHFHPAIDDYINAANNIGFGTVIKVVLALKEKIWPEQTGFIFSKEIIPTWWTQYPVDNNLITGWVGGPAAARISQHTDDELLDMAVASLTAIFGFSSADALRNIIDNSYVFNWSKYNESLGAYSFSKPESKSARKLLNTPIDDTIYFAGEGLYDGPYSGTVEAALSSGSTTAAALLGSTDTSRPGNQ